MKKFSFSIAFLLLFFLILIFSSSSAEAADLNIDCSSGCTKSGLDPLFSQALDGYWMPGKITTRVVNLKNSSPDTKEIAIKAERTSTVSILEDVLSITVLRSSLVVWAGSLNDFYNQSKVSMGIFYPGADQDFDLTAFLNLSADNNYQNKETVFNLTLGFWQEEAEQEPTNTPTPADGVYGGPSDGGGVSPPVCSDPKPNMPTNLTAAAGPGAGQATLGWSDPITPPDFTYYLVAYSDSSWPPKWGNPNIGKVTSFIVSGLPAGPSYFWVRAGNGCMPGDFTGPVAVNIISGVTGGVAVGFLPEVLGVTNITPTPAEEFKQPEEAEEVKGEHIEEVCERCIWWQILLGEAIVLLIYYFKIVKKYKGKREALTALTMAVLAYLVFLYLNKGCRSNLIFCKYFYLSDTLVYLTISLFFKKRTQNSKPS